MNPSTNITSQLGSTEDNISQSNNNVKSDTLSNNSNMQDNIKYLLSNKELGNSSFLLDQKR